MGTENPEYEIILFAVFAHLSISLGPRDCLVALEELSEHVDTSGYQLTNTLLACSVCERNNN